MTRQERIECEKRDEENAVQRALYFLRDQLDYIEAISALVNAQARRACWTVLEAENPGHVRLEK